jgi:hypothetical protein
LRSLSITLQDLDVCLSGYELEDAHQEKLRQVVQGCEDVLHALEDLTFKYRELDQRGGDLTKKAVRVWKRLRWEPEEVHELRDRIQTNVAFLTALMGSISS